jgi:mercuric ion transport protein
VSEQPAADRKNARRGLSRALAILPGASLTLLPIGACPACWPAYAGLLGSLGLGFLLDSTYLLPLMGAFLALALGTLGYRAKGRRGYGPLALGVVATGMALLGKFTLASNVLLYVGLGSLVAASIWNTWPRKAARAGSCGKCAAQASGPKRPGVPD